MDGLAVDFLYVALFVRFGSFIIFLKELVAMSTFP